MIPQLPDVLHKFWNWLTGGNALVRVGVVVLFFGVAFLLKYAYEHTHVPVELRLIGVALGACVMLVIGWRLRQSKPVYALAIQGGGVGVLYLTVFGAFRMFNLLPGEPVQGASAQCTARYFTTALLFSTRMCHRALSVDLVCSHNSAAGNLYHTV